MFPVDPADSQFCPARPDCPDPVPSIRATFIPCPTGLSPAFIPVLPLPYLPFLLPCYPSPARAQPSITRCRAPPRSFVLPSFYLAVPSAVRIRSFCRCSSARTCRTCRAAPVPTCPTCSPSGCPSWMPQATCGYLPAPVGCACPVRSGFPVGLFPTDGCPVLPHLPWMIPQLTLPLDCCCWIGLSLCRIGLDYPIYPSWMDYYNWMPSSQIQNFLRIHTFSSFGLPATRTTALPSAHTYRKFPPRARPAFLYLPAPDYPVVRAACRLDAQFYRPVPDWITGSGRPPVDPARDPFDSFLWIRPPS